MAICSSQLNATNSPLLRLPAEIRIAIYEYVLGGGTFKFDGRLKFGNPQASFEDNKIDLLYVCRQINAEAALLPYALNEFIFAYDSEDALPIFLRNRSPEQLKSTKMVEQGSGDDVPAWSSTALFWAQICEHW